MAYAARLVLRLRAVFFISTTLLRFSRWLRALDRREAVFDPREERALDRDRALALPRAPVLRLRPRVVAALRRPELRETDFRLLELVASLEPVFADWRLRVLVVLARFARVRDCPDLRLDLPRAPVRWRVRDDRACVLPRRLP